MKKDDKVGRKEKRKEGKGKGKKKTTRKYFKFCLSNVCSGLTPSCPEKQFGFNLKYCSGLAPPCPAPRRPLGGASSSLSAGQKKKIHQTFEFEIFLKF